MRRAFLFVMDSFGIGGANDAAKFGDQGANTLGTIAAFRASRGTYTKPDILNPEQFATHRALQIPNMLRLGLAQAAELASGVVPAGLEPNTLPQALWGAADEISQGKDTPSGHWEIAGLPVPFDWGYFPRSIPTFPDDLTNAIITQAELPGILGNCHASGIDIIQALGEEHIRTGKPILYTSADSVIQVAAHEQHFGLERLYQVCLMLRKLADPLNIGRIIARPFTGETPDDFERSPNRRDYAVPPPQDTLLDLVKNSGHQVFAVGKISDIFAGFGVTQSRKANGNDALFDASLQAMREAGDGDLVFSNFVDFDMLYGHRRDIAGYADALEAFDRRLPEAFALMQEGDLLVLTADHGCDPGWAGTDHTRERVPVLALGYGAGSIGLRSSFADISASIIEHLGLGQNHHDHKLYGMSFLPATGPKLEPVAG